MLRRRKNTAPLPVLLGIVNAVLGAGLLWSLDLLPPKTTFDHKIVALVVFLSASTVIFGYLLFLIPLRKILRGKLTAEPTAPGKVAERVLEISYVHRVLQKYHRALNQGFELSRLVLTSVKDGYQLIDSKNRTVEVNQALCELIGKSRESFEFRDDPFFYLDDQALELALQFLDLARSGDPTLRSAFEAEVRNVDGSWHPVTLKMHVIESARAGDYLVAVLLERDRADQELSNIAKDRARFEGFVSLAAGVAHNLNNLLTSIISSASMLDGAFGEPDKSTTKKLVKTIKIAADRSADLCKDLVSISQMESGQGTRTAVDVLEVIAEAVEVGKSLRTEPVTEFVLELPNTPVLGLCEKSGLHQVLLNLITNSVDAMPSGGTIRVRVFETERVTGPFVSVVVQDSGTGINNDVIGKVFDPFFTTKKGRERKDTFGGSGIGLTTALRVVESWGGTIECGSEVGNGSTFTVHIPSARSKGQELRPT